MTLNWYYWHITNYLFFIIYIFDMVDINTFRYKFDQTLHSLK